MNNLVWIIKGFGWLAAVVLLVMGAFFFFDPSTGLEMMTHVPENLPLVMGGRYLLFGVLLVGALLYGDYKVMGFLSLALGSVAMIDGFIYWNTAPLLHFAVGVYSYIGSAFFFHFAKGTTS